MKYEYIGEQSITLHGNGEAGASMSEAEEIKLPEPVAWMHIQGNHCDPSLRQLDEGEASRGWIESPLYTAEQVCAAILAERERCARVCEELWMIDGTHTAKEFAAAIRRGSV